MLHLQTIDTRTLELLKELMTIPEFDELILVGGTALALQIGHRKSIDLDMFGNLNVNYDTFITILKSIGDTVILNRSSNIISVLINSIKVDFVNYPYNLLQPYRNIDHIRLASKADIAAMKLAAITGRGTKKDFIDLFFIFDHYSLSDIFRFYNAKFDDSSEFMVLKSLTYFDDAEKDPLPVMLEKINWENVKSTIISNTKAYLDSK